MPTVAPYYENEYLTDRLNTEAVNFIRRNKDKPFFLYLSHYAVHTTLAGKPEVTDSFSAKPDAAKKRNNPELAAMLASIDDGIGRIAEILAELNIARKTVVIFTSDNGGESRVTSNAPLRGGKSDLYEGGVRVPMIVRWPDVVREASVCDVPVTTVDFYPTFLEMAGGKGEEGHVLDGESLVPVLKGDGKLKRDAIYWHYPLSKPHFLGGCSSGAVRRGPFKLIEFFDSGKAELYDLSRDIGESTDLANTMPQKVGELRGLLETWRASAVFRSPLSWLGWHGSAP